MLTCKQKYEKMQRRKSRRFIKKEERLDIFPNKTVTLRYYKLANGDCAISFKVTDTKKETGKG